MKLDEKGVVVHYDRLVLEELSSRSESHVKILVYKICFDKMSTEEAVRYIRQTTDHGFN